MGDPKGSCTTRKPSQHSLYIIIAMSKPSQHRLYIIIAVLKPSQHKLYIIIAVMSVKLAGSTVVRVSSLEQVFTASIALKAGLWNTVSFRSFLLPVSYVRLLSLYDPLSTLRKRESFNFERPI